MELSPIFSNHMVLQRNKPIRIWGEGNEDVTIVLNGQSKTVPSKNGKWTAILNPETAGGPFELCVCDSKEKIVLRDVMIGDVWLAAGQSNMECVTFLANDGISDAQKIGNNNNIRYFTVPRRTKKGEQVRRWHFENVLSEDKEWEVSKAETTLHFSAIGFWFAHLLQKEEHVPVGIISCNFGGTCIETWIEYNRIISEPVLAYAVEKYTKIQNDLNTESYLLEHNNYLQEMDNFCKKFNALEMSQEMGLRQFAVNPGLPWPNDPPMGPYSQNFGGVLFENMIKPIAPFGLSGVLWYQGESNAKNACHYSDAFKVMVNNWREAFNDELPFITVQIAPYDNYADKDSRMILNQEQIKATIDNENVFLITTEDVGEPDNIHPLNKKQVAERLFAAAQSKVYGKGNEYCGPIACCAKLAEDDKIIVSFNHATQGLLHNEDVKDVYVANEQGVFLEAKAHTENSVLVVECGQFLKPVAVKMGYSNYSVTNLFNAEGFPAMPFYFEL